MADTYRVNYTIVRETGHYLHHKKADGYIRDGIQGVEEGWCNWMHQVIDADTDDDSKAKMIGILFMAEEAGHHIMKKGIVEFDDMSFREAISRISAIGTEEDRAALGGSLYASYFHPGRQTFQEYFNPSAVMKWFLNTMRGVTNIMKEIQKNLLAMSMDSGMECYMPILEYISQVYLPTLIKFGENLTSPGADVFALVEQGPGMSVWFDWFLSLACFLVILQ